ncbi:MAG: NAD(P)H-dependent oxidoreductase [Mesorhizobium sp.]|uniref:NADPH-dependent FMN reductase n=1 Tax=Mesorhizobium sp. TaxID=1871066 RepID=UPI000FE4C088|nr:NAD(P)H-dependent oxidoreductase [Mesorhizobium sp.]RWB40298.1 MAG: NADPH-dependent oxidoreductase [Mesorhizobium sp.]RWB57892.1 MAG: NADPH-dependent oxidoreductase [Mesorhizobium sp.]RWB82116.1 MAG: NADPH-dependent oxidoreductase [Mesorhizobium sp.]RWD75822.1 MAG: NADPH-dependent oxidoreductase [Mesorhizobium sp.]TIU75358.1 MAG: NAD(P)H-dependent oxidoreductase [Mesorhizobium sp.]
MRQPNIAVIMSTTRATRYGIKPAKWIYELAVARGDITVELIDLRDYPMPFFDEPASNAWVPSQNEVAVRWQRKVAEFDGYIFVTAEYNRGLPAVLKNALDYAYPEWNRKPAACLGYGSVGAARSVEHLRLSCIELQMAPTRTGVHIQGTDFFEALQNGKDLNTIPYIGQNAVTMLDELHWWATALISARAGSAQQSAI